MWIQNISIKLKPVPKCGAPDIFKNTSVKKLRIGQDLHCTKALDPILELKPSLNQLIFEGDSLTLRCRSYNLRMKDDKKLADDKIYWGYSETIPEENLLQDIFYHNPQVKFPSVLIDSRSSDSGILDTILRIPYVSRNHSGNYDCRLVSQQANLSRSVSVLVISEKTKYCHATETSSNKGDYSWPKTIVQKTVVLPCVSEVSQNAFASKKCNELGFWEKADVSKCPYVREETRILEQFANMNFSIARSSIIESAKRLKDYIEDNFQDFQDPMDVIYISKTIQSYLEFIKEEQGIAPLIIDIVSLVMDFPKKLLEKAQVQDNACKRLIESAEIATSTTLSPDSQKNNMAIEMFKLTSESFIEIQCSWYFNVEHSSRTFECNSAGKTRSLHDKNIEASISFPAAHVITPNEQRLLVSVYKNDNFFSQNKTFNNYRVTSSIIGIKLFASDGTKLNVKNLSDPILIALKSTPFHHDLSFPKPGKFAL
jgi:G protein-coupled receptor 125